MNGIDPYEYINEMSINLDAMDNREEVLDVLDRLEYLFEVIPPELQDIAENLMVQLRIKLEQFS